MKIFWFLLLSLLLVNAQDDSTCGEGCNSQREIISESCGPDCKSYSFPKMTPHDNLPGVSNILLKIPECVDFVPTYSPIEVSHVYMNGDITIESQCNYTVEVFSDFEEDNPNCQPERESFNNLSVVKIEFDTEDCEDPLNITMDGTVWAEDCPMGFFLGFKGGQECCSCNTDGLVCPPGNFLFFV